MAGMSEAAPVAAPEVKKKRAYEGCTKIANDMIRAWTLLTRRTNPEPMTYTEAQKIATLCWRAYCGQDHIPVEKWPIEEEIKKHLARKGYLADPFVVLTQAAAGRTCSQWAEVDWVKQHILFDPAQIEASGVPSQGAPALLKWARENQKEFYATWGKRMEKPDTADAESELDKAFDGTSVHEMLDEFLRLLDEQEERERRKAG